MSIKKPNRLAHTIDHQSFAGGALPQSLSKTFTRYEQATIELKTLLVDCLPEEILDTCWVVGLTDDQLTLSVVSSTAANHIRYLQKAYLSVLTNQSVTFQHLKQIHIVLTTQATHYSKTGSVNNVSESYKATPNKALSQNTKRTISQALDHVITDKGLQNALLKLKE